MTLPKSSPDTDFPEYATCLSLHEDAGAPVGTSLAGEDDSASPEAPWNFWLTFVQVIGLMFAFLTSFLVALFVLESVAAHSTRQVVEPAIPVLPGDTGWHNAPSAATMLIGGAGVVAGKLIQQGLPSAQRASSWPSLLSLEPTSWGWALSFNLQRASPLKSFSRTTTTAWPSPLTSGARIPVPIVL